MQHWGLVYGTIAGKRWTWYPGSCPTLYPIVPLDDHCSSLFLIHSLIYISFVESSDTLMHEFFQPWFLQCQGGNDVLCAYHVHLGLCIFKFIPSSKWRSAFSKQQVRYAMTLRYISRFQLSGLWPRLIDWTESGPGTFASLWEGWSQNCS